jgi:PAS domain S-box-containing protein
MMAEGTILVVDDNEASRYVVARILRHAGYRVTEAATGDETLSAIARERPDLVILDVTLPDTDGYEICRRLKAEPATASVLVLHLSATFVHAGDAVRGLDGGADGYLTQPVDPPVLLATIRALLRVRQVEAALRESEARHRTLFEHNPLPTWVLDADTRMVIGVNAAAIAQYGYSREEFLTIVIDDLGHRLDEPAPAAIGSESTALWRHRTKGGSSIDVELTEAALTFGPDRVRLVMAKDVTDRRQAEQTQAALLAVEQQARQDAEAANRAKDEFLAMLGHELRNPLAAIATGVAILERTGADPGTVSRTLAMASRQVKHLSRLLDDLLDVGRLMAGKMSLQAHALELGAVVAQTAASFQATAREAEHRLVVDAREVWVRGDATRLDEIVGNLISNAVKYTPRGGVITVRVGPVGEEAMVAVEDTGIGIDASLLQRVFELFVQGAQTIDRDRGGLGLGLTLVKRLVELHGGTVEVASPGLGRGSRFTVRLPAIPPPGPQLLIPSTPPTRRRRIVVVEDHEDSRILLRQLLELNGHEVYEAADGVSGLAEIIRVRPDVALVDLGLPGLDGYEVARKVREACQGSVAIVALTGYDLADYRQRSREAGFDDHLVKPVSSDALSRILAAPPTPPRIVDSS